MSINEYIAFKYIFENGIVEESAYPFYSGMIGKQVYIHIFINFFN